MAAPAHAAPADPVPLPGLDGLAGPLGLAVGSDGTVYVAQLFSGEVIAVDRKGRRTVVAEEGAGGGIVAAGRGQVVYTVSEPPEAEGEPGETLLVRTTASGKTRTLASLSEFEAANNPDAVNQYGFVGLDDECTAQLPEFLPQPQPYAGIVESNPYAVTRHRGQYIVADAAGNSIVRVSPDGDVSTVAILPPVPAVVTEELAAEIGLPACTAGATYNGEPVPTDVEVGPDGAYYVTSLPGAPELPGTGSVFRVDPATGDVTQVATGFSGATDLAVACDGTIYVAELFGGRVSSVSIDGGTPETVAELPFPGAVELGRNGKLYVTTMQPSDDPQGPPFGPGSVVTLKP